MSSSRGGGRTAWGLSGLALVLLAGSLVLVALGHGTSLPAGFVPWSGQLVALLGAAGPPILGAILVSRLPWNRYGWAWCAFGLALSVLLSAGTYATYAVVHPGALPAPGAVAVVGDVAWITWISLLPFLLLWFPTGHAPSRRWRLLPRVVVAAAIVTALTGAFRQQLGVVPIDNPLAVSSASGDLLFVVSEAAVYLIFASIPAAAVSVALRYRRAGRTERRQIMWFAYAAVIVGVFVLSDPFVELPGSWDAVLETAALAGLYVAIGIAVLRHGLYDIDRIVNRTVVYAAVTACLVAVYVLVVGYLGSLFRVDDGPIVSLLATGLVAVLFAPLRDRLQQVVNRMMFGRRAEPYEVISQLGRRLEASLSGEDVLVTIVETIAETLELPQVEIWFVEEDRLHLGAAHGDSTDADTASDMQDLRGMRGIALVLPLAHRGQNVGALCLAPHDAAEGFTDADLALLRDLATQAGPATHAVALTAQLRASLDELWRSRERIVVSQQEERLRIHRDLHDGLGPVLASMRLRLEACLEVAQRSAPDLNADLERLHELVGQATADIRTLVHDLHPPALAQLGLGRALHQHCDRFGRETGLDVHYTGPKELRLPAATEVALLRIAQEALLNVSKHANATRAEVALHWDGDDLELAVRDDGVGLQARRTGLGTGIGSMHARAELLGGTLQLAPVDGAGLLVSVRVPAGEAAIRG